MIQKKLDIFLKRLDSASTLSNGSSFNSHKDKELYESYLNFSFYRYNAAKYHLTNVEKLKKKEIQKSEKFREINKIKGVELKYFGANQSFSYEISSFLAAIRSSIDFLVVPSSFHIKGLHLDSVSVLIKSLRNNEQRKTQPIYNVINRHLDWIKFLKEYRDRLVHKSVISINVGYEISTDMPEITHYPITVPLFPPKLQVDTRRSRAHHNIEHELDSMFSKLTITKDGETTDLEVKKEFFPSFERIEITEFMNQQLAQFETFFVEMVNEYESTGFKKINILNES